MGVSSSVVVVIAPDDDRVWVDAQSLVDHLRSVELDTGARSEGASCAEDAIGFFAASEMARQLADALVLMQLSAMDAASEAPPTA